jgi:hypothetical protein
MVLTIVLSENICLSAGVQLPPLQPIQKIQDQLDKNPTPSDLENKFQQTDEPMDTSTPSRLSRITPLTPDFSVNYPKINQIEQLLFGKNYPHQDISTRLSRIEKTMFQKSFEKEQLAKRVDNITTNFYGTNHSLITVNQLPNGALSNLEQSILGQTFNEDDEQMRLSRLEQKVFGASQNGEIKNRYKKIQMALKNNNPMQYGNNPNFAYSQQPKRGIRGFLNNMAQNFSGGYGTMTGFTPPIDNSFDLGGMNAGTNYGNPYNCGYTPAYNNQYNGYNGGYGMYHGLRTNTGYSDSFKSYGSGTGVTILD